MRKKISLLIVICLAVHSVNLPLQANDDFWLPEIEEEQPKKSWLQRNWKQLGFLGLILASVGGVWVYKKKKSANDCEQPDPNSTDVIATPRLAHVSPIASPVRPLRPHRSPIVSPHPSPRPSQVLPVQPKPTVPPRSRVLDERPPPSPGRPAKLGQKLDWRKPVPFTPQHGAEHGYSLSDDPNRDTIKVVVQRNFYSPEQIRHLLHKYGKKVVVLFGENNSDYQPSDTIVGLADGKARSGQGGQAGAFDGYNWLNTHGIITTDFKGVGVATLKEQFEESLAALEALLVRDDVIVLWPVDHSGGQTMGQGIAKNSGIASDVKNGLDNLLNRMRDRGAVHDLGQKEQLV